MQNWAHASRAQGQSEGDKLHPLHVRPHWNLSVLTRASPSDSFMNVLLRQLSK